jgi:hypothetical protein
MRDPIIDQSAEVFNRELLEQLNEAPDGMLKNASTASSNMIRRKIRENGFMRLILPPKPVGNEDLDRLPDTELPVIIEDMEPSSEGAKSISFNDTADTAFQVRVMLSMGEMFRTPSVVPATGWATRPSRAFLQVSQLGIP